MTDSDDTGGTDAERESDQHGDSSAVDENGDEAALLDAETFADVIQDIGRPVVTASHVAQALDWTQEEASTELDRLADERAVDRLDVSADPVVWYPTDWADLVDRERVILFPGRREIVIDHPTQFTRAQLSQFAHLVDTTHRGGYLYELRREDIWGAPYDDFEDLLGTVRDVLPERSPELEAWIEDQWKRAHRFTLRTHEDGYVVLEAATDSLMGNVAREKLDEGQLRAAISDTESWVAEEAVAEVKRTLYEAGYPVQDERDLDTGDDLALDLTLDLRDYQHEWVSEFLETKSGVLVGPPGAGKTVAALAILARVGGESLILVPSRELAGQWREEILARTTLTEEQVGEYHGGEKTVAPVTIATYQTAGMDRHRQLFDSREWGLVIYDEVHHIPAAVARRSADLQTKHRLGLSSSPVREDDREEEIYTLIGPPIGTDWDALFEAGFVAEPEVEIRYVPWDDEDARNQYVSSDGHERRQLAASNPAKMAEARYILSRHPDKKAIVFCDYLDQGRALSAALDVPFVSGEMPHSRRERLLGEFRRGDRDTLIVSRVGDEGIDLPDAELAVVASGLGGSRRQGAQRAGRTMRPEGRSLVYVLATRGSREEDFAQRRMRHLSSKGVRVSEAEAEAVTDADADADGVSKGDAADGTEGTGDSDTDSDS
ncbi:DNA excision repair protein ERCC-3 [Halorientalis persicus]|uniref:Putative DNA 3'-5' helicase Rad25 n=1 Tax=Halorientalis persicus TaxID=1367881 RepID=A0A1H8M6Y0_9EURY|nr:DEAD/DEAH box helicase [Halorientalis persicus]SEO13010.1 DNA excision repair protein ERCC-3 [Halorientalis persicus]